MKITIKRVTIGIVLILIDLSVYIILGTMMMAYDDNYDERKGEYWSWESMTDFDRAVVIGLNFWHLVNFVVACSIIYKVIKFLKLRFNLPIKG